MNGKLVYSPLGGPSTVKWHLNGVLRRLLLGLIVGFVRWSAKYRRCHIGQWLSTFFVRGFQALVYGAAWQRSSNYDENFQASKHVPQDTSTRYLTRLHNCTQTSIDLVILALVDAYWRVLFIGTNCQCLYIISYYYNVRPMALCDGSQSSNLALLNRSLRGKYTWSNILDLLQFILGW